MHRHRNLLQGFHGTMNFENRSGKRPGCKTNAENGKADPIKLSSLKNKIDVILMMSQEYVKLLSSAV